MSYVGRHQASTDLRRWESVESKEKVLVVNLKVRKGFRWYITMWKLKQLQREIEKASSMLHELAGEELEVDVVLND